MGKYTAKLKTTRARYLEKESEELVRWAKQCGNNNNKHRWCMFADTTIVDYRLSFASQIDKLRFSVTVRSKQTKVCSSCFLFAGNTLKFPFTVSFVFHLQNSGNTETRGWRYGNTDMGHGNEHSRHGILKNQMEHGSSGDFP
jgi:hypothetical protein